MKSSMIPASVRSRCSVRADNTTIRMHLCFMDHTPPASLSSIPESIPGQGTCFLHPCPILPHAQLCRTSDPRFDRAESPPRRYCNPISASNIRPRFRCGLRSPGRLPLIDPGSPTHRTCILPQIFRQRQPRLQRINLYARAIIRSNGRALRQSIRSCILIWKSE